MHLTLDAAENLCQIGAIEAVWLSSNRKNALVQILLTA